MERNYRALKVIFSCLLGAGLGTLIACSVNIKFFWVGILAGGLIGYLSYDFKEIYYACNNAFKRVFAWRPDWTLWRLGFRTSRWIFFVLLQYSILFVIFLWRINIEFVISIPIFAIGSIFGSMWVGFWIAKDFHKGNESEFGKDYSDFRIIAFYMGPIGFLPLFFFYILPVKIIWWCIRRIPRAIVSVGHFFVLLGRFTKTVFILIHSELRLLCGVDALFGALIGFLIKQFYGGTLSVSVIIGACTGAFIGYLNYEIVSKRILKVVPVRNK